MKTKEYLADLMFDKYISSFEPYSSLGVKVAFSESTSKKDFTEQLVDAEVEACKEYFENDVSKKD